ncbi:hypothetical protein EVAR_77328_1 [Eumeta japonica]|uniref:Uncharacterized protein n=1 Tax=Eumeta variegata TaxID=151549 RepID=A0A4C1UZ05_EUMVA|nr:hypothetical protein EVAR_77328_1 [Eumeta japonica]
MGPGLALTWRIKANTDKSVQVTFTLRRKTCPPVKLCNVEIPQADDAKYLAMGTASHSNIEILERFQSKTMSHVQYPTTHKQQIYKPRLESENGERGNRELQQELPNKT